MLLFQPTTMLSVRNYVVFKEPNNKLTFIRIMNRETTSIKNYRTEIHRFRKYTS